MRPFRNSGSKSFKRKLWEKRTLAKTPLGRAELACSKGVFMCCTESVKKHPRNSGEKAKRPQSWGRAFPVDARCTAGAVQKVVRAARAQPGKLESGEARIPGALSSAERGTALCTSGNFGETRRLQEWGLSRRRAKQFESCVRTSLNPLMGTVILWIANFQCHTVHHGALAADDRQLLLFRKADRFAFV